MNYTYQQIADWFLSQVDRDSGDSITHLKLQKLVYYAQAWSLALLDRALFDEDFEAWAHGPVLRELYSDLKHYGWDAIPAPERSLPEFDHETRELLLEVYRVYGEKRAKTLEILTHQEAPWLEARDGCAPEERCDNIIPKPRMKAFYRQMYEQTQ